MNISPINNNSQTFGMSLKFKNDGAKTLAEFLDRSGRLTKEYTENRILPDIHSLKTEIVLDGDEVLINGANVSETVPHGVSGSKNRVLAYNLGGKEYLVTYNEPMKSRLQYIEICPFLQKLFNAKEIAKDMDAKTGV